MHGEGGGSDPVFFLFSVFSRGFGMCRRLSSAFTGAKKFNRLIWREDFLIVALDKRTRHERENSEPELDQ